jgi:hypothetical protein
MNADVDLATDLYLAGYPLVVSLRTFQRLAARNGVNRLAMQTSLSGPRHRTVVAPNQDTLYSMAVLDLRAGPLLLTHPPVPDRYFSLQFLDMWTESFAYIGTRATGGRGGRWLIAGPGWRGEPPADADLISSPTDQLFIIGRYLVDGDADVKCVLDIGAAVELAPWSPDQTAPPPPGIPAGRPQEVPADASFFDELGVALQTNPATSLAQFELFETGSRLGVGPGRTPTATGDAVDLAVLERGAAIGNERIAAPRAKGVGAGPWGVDLVTGRYGERWLHRAQVARLGWGANVPEESLYAVARQDSEGWLLDGSHRYLVRTEERVPPVDAFWSLTVYGPDMFFVEHPAGRYAITCPAGIGASIVLSHDEPELAGAMDWLPVPTGPFVLMLRLYLPRPEAIDGTYRFPDIELIGP